jgi:hypothetical protein
MVSHELTDVGEGSRASRDDGYSVLMVGVCFS